MHDLIRTVIAFVVVLGVLVFIHELGHYLAARWRGVKVETFSIGFGPPLLKWKDRAGTEWRVGPIPLGGFVKPHGFEGPEEATPEQQAAWEPGRTFHDKPVLSRAIIIVAGPVFNFLLAFVLFTILFATCGQPKVKNEVGSVMAGSAAAVAGLKPGDAITAIGSVATVSAVAVQQAIAVQPDQKTVLHVKRNEQDIDLPVTIGAVPGAGSSKATGQLGVTFATVAGAPVSLPMAVVDGAKATWTTTVQTLDGLWQMITGRHSARDLGGPLRIAQLSGQVAQYGIVSLLSFMALLSVNLGLINLFPVPILDGGRLVFYLAEAVRGRPVPKKVQELGFQAGFALIAGLFLFSTFNDLSSFGLFRWMASLAG
ncbi:RIP metalloprotease RseP [Acetobacter oeni]|uniref:Zinc metalloprotease n=1 Tax=Acetobacter oeni TaxID=304077 RepID=A0A511XGA4_9PROT|nr:RIP metalloprotease RseP [Acetobacter oeni]NHO17864.1 RIP metalloprotease RseP [Acetobacter oeni]GBR03314.1 zinc metallopeptidase [Acetobacter oeni LMG 21952]GEN61976.1 zinc metalloprotease [Acetobacter oeni]